MVVELIGFVLPVSFVDVKVVVDVVIGLKDVVNFVDTS